MACIPNLLDLINLDFAAANDAPNWSTDGLTPVQTVGGKLVINPSSLATIFTRPLGTVDPLNNRIRIRTNFELITQGISGPASAQVVFELLEGVNVIRTSCAEFEDLTGQDVAFFLDRTYNFIVMPTGPLTLRITFPEGWQYKAEFSDLIAQDFNYCADNVRAYFVLKDFFEQAITATSAAINLLAWEVDGVETLTPDFFSENNIFGGNPLADWLLAKADPDGTPRNSDDITPNSFNPFVNDWGLLFENVAGNFHGGKPLGTISGSDYGSAILGIGLGVPVILDGNLDPQAGAFFIDQDLEKDLEIRFNALINPTETNPFSGPTLYREYTIQFFAETCETRFFYIDQLTGDTVDQANFGWLAGLAANQIPQTVVQCDETFAPVGNQGNFTFRLELGAAIGQSGINYNAYGVPDRFIVNYDGVDYDTGFVGLNTYDAALLAAGVAPGDINTAPSPGNGSGVLNFPKPNPTPTFATVTVEAPLGGTGWQISGICPAPVIPNTPPTVTFTTTVNPNAGGNAQFSIVASDAEGPISNYQIDWGDGSPILLGVGPPPTSITHVYATAGNYTAQITVFDNGSPQLSDSDTAGVTVSSFSGNPISPGDEFQTNCYSCFEFSLVVPDGETYDLEVTSSFDAPAVYATGFCDPGGGSIGIGSDGTTSYGPGTYNFHTGIDAAQSAPNANLSKIFIRVKDGGTTLQLYTVERSHDNAIC